MIKRCLTNIIAVILGVCLSYAGGKRALLIGISDYPSHKGNSDISWPSIHGANDVIIISKTLKRQGFSINSLTNKQATAKQIRQAFKKLVDESKPGDLVYIHFSGHGQAYEDYSGDEADGWDEALVPYDAMMQYRQGVYDGSNHILDDEIDGYLTDIRKKVGKTGFVYVVLDACHMGGASRGDEIEEDETFIRGTDQGFTSKGKKYIPKIDRRGNISAKAGSALSGLCVLEACRSYQTNFEIKQNGTYYGPLTYYVNQCLQSKNLTADINWIESVRSLMNKDKRLVKQNMVSETSNQ